MAYPIALGQRPLEDREAYEALAQYSTDYGRAPLLLMMHAAVPETLRADLLNLIRVNFMAAQGADTSLEADVLFSPLTTALGGGYYRIDPQVRWHCLVMLRSLYRGDQRPRIRRIAELLWRYVEAREHQANRAADPQLAEFLDIQRWVALAFLEPNCAVHAFADALNQVGDTRSSVALRLGGLTSAIEIPLAGQPELLAYARGMDALVGGNEDEARHILSTLEQGEIRVGSVILKSPKGLLADFYPSAIETDESNEQVAQQRTCFVIMGFGRKTDHTTGRVQDLDQVYDMIRDVVESAGMKCVRADDIAGNDIMHAIYRQIVSSDFVICYLTTVDISTYYLSGVCLALRPTGTWLITEKEISEDFSAKVPRLDAMYSQTISFISTEDRQSFDSSLRTILWEHFSANPDQTAPFIGRLDSPLYTSGNLLPPEILAEKPSDTPWSSSPLSFENVCFVIQGYGTETKPSSGRMVDIDAYHTAIRKAVLGAGLSLMRADEVEQIVGNETPLRPILFNAPVVIAHLSSAAPDVLIQLGIRHGLRPRQTLLIADEKVKLPVELSSLRILRYKHLGEDLGSREAARLQKRLTEWIKSTLGSPAVDSPVYLALQTLRPPRSVQAQEHLTPESPLPSLRAAPILETSTEPPSTVEWQAPEGGRHIKASKEWARLEITEASTGLSFIFSTDKTRSQETLATGQLSLADDFIRSACVDTDPNANAAKTLFELLLPLSLKEGSLLQGNIVLIVDQQSARYPWELLENRWGIDSRPLSVEAGMIRQIKSHKTLTRSTSSYHNTALVIGNPDVSPSPDFVSLPGASEEARSVAHALANAGYQVTDCIDEQARTILQALHREKWRILHLAGQGVREYQSVTMSVARSGMVIGHDIILTPGDINQMRWMPELVFINCCHLGHIDGHGKTEPGALAANLSEQFINMGVKAVIAAGWAVDDLASKAFAESFYRRMLVGELFGEAVRAAREEIYLRYPDVNTWGAYQCYGEPDYRLYDGG